MERDARRVSLKLLLVSEHVLGEHLRPPRVGKDIEVARGPRQHLYPKIAHLVPRPLTPEHARGWLLRVARILGGVVERIAHRERRAPRQREGRHVAIYVLPPEIPVLYINEGLCRPIGQRGGAAHIPRAVVRMRLHGFDVDIDGQDK